MSDYYSSIWIKSCSKDKLEELIQKEQIFNLRSSPFYFFVEINNYEYEFNYAKQFELENNIEASLSDCKFDFSDFYTHVELSCQIGSFGDAIIDQLTDSLAIFISTELKVETATCLPNLETPSFVYKNGVLMKDFSDDHSEYFDKRMWIKNQNYVPY